MKCARCNEKMESSDSSGVATNTCFYCNGIWVGGESMTELLTKENSQSTVVELQQVFKQQNQVCDNRYCPVCEKEKLHQINIKKIELDLCLNCGGLFFDEGEIKGILPMTHQSSKNHDLFKTKEVEFLVKALGCL